MATLQPCIPRGKTYLIIESINQKGGIPQLQNTVGPSLTQVLRQVITTCDVTDGYYNGKRFDENSSPLLGLAILFNQGKIERRPTGDIGTERVYVGTRNVVVPVQKIGDLVPDALLKPRTLIKALSPISFGVDPIPAIQLYGNKAISFISTGGGDNPPTAMAFYHTDTHKIELLSEIEMVRIIKKLEELG